MWDTEFLEIPIMFVFVISHRFWKLPKPEYTIFMNFSYGVQNIVSIYNENLNELAYISYSSYVTDNIINVL